MATAFTAQKREQVQHKLIETARNCASSIGMRKTTVDQLALAAGISKGAFYKFYPTKELLFFEVLEQLHTEIYGHAQEILLQCKALPPSDRAATLVLAICRQLDELSMAHFWENDLPLILRKIPPETQAAHYHSDETHIKQLLHCAGLTAQVSDELSSAAVRAIMLTLSHRREIGPLYFDVLECIVRGTCKQLFQSI